MIYCQKISVLLALLAAYTLLLSIASSVSAADANYNGKCDLELCTCFTYDGAACPEWMEGDMYDGSSSTTNGVAGDDDDAGTASDTTTKSSTCSSYNTLFNDDLFKEYPSESTAVVATDASADEASSPMKSQGNIYLTSWIIRDGENGTVLVNYTASDPAPDCSTLTPPPTVSPTATPTPNPTSGESSSSSSGQIATVRMSLLTTSSSIAILAVVGTLL